MRRALIPKRWWGRTLIVLAAAATVGGTATAALASIPDSTGAIHGCYSANGAGGTNGTQLNIIDSALASCSKGQTAITWNQVGQQGPAGPQGVPGPAGPGYVFTSTTGIDGPALTQDGAYYVDVTAGLNNFSGTPLIGSCAVIAKGFKPYDLQSVQGAFVLPPGSGTSFSFSGIAIVTNASSSSPVTPTIDCQDTSFNVVTPDTETWYVSPVSIGG